MNGVQRRSGSARSALTLIALTLGACSHAAAPPSNEPSSRPAHPDWPTTALPKVHEASLAGEALVFHAADGGGKAWLEPANPPIVAHRGQHVRATLIYEAGELGIAENGALFLQVSPFWGWSTPQTTAELGEGFTRVTTEASGVRLECETIDTQLLAIHVRGRALKSGERVRLEYGAGEALAHADDFAERDSRFWIAVDGDGDGVRKLIDESPFIAVLPTEPTQCAFSAPSSAKPAQPLQLRLALLDSEGNACRDAQATFEIVDAPSELALTSTETALRGSRSLDATLAKEGVYRLRVRVRTTSTADSAGREFDAVSNPIVVGERAPRILWGDLHGHSCRSDGTGTPEEWYEYARDYAALDVVALTDHDHWGLQPLDHRPDVVDEIRRAAREAERPGSFTALAGFEWTSWIWGHRNVVWFDDSSAVLSSIDARYDTPQKLWSALRGRAVIAIPHHPAGGPIAVDWRNAGDPELEPLVEICSAHGSSEAPDSPNCIYAAHPGCFARDALARGLALGFLASGDSHDGHPGLCHLGAHYPTGGVAAILAEDNSRAAILAALRARRVYATSGPRIVLRFAIGSHRMGETASAGELGDATLFVNVSGTAPIAHVDLVESGERVTQFDGSNQPDLVLTGKVGALQAGDWLYVRVVQTDGGLAWSSPIFVR